MKDHIMRNLVFLLLWDICASRKNDIVQPISILNARLGDGVKIECHLRANTNFNYMVWFKLNSSMMIQNIVKTPKYLESEIHLNKDFDDGRFSVFFNNLETFYLNIVPVQQEDVGTYYCGKIYMNELTFADGTFLILTDITSGIKAIEQQPVSESVKPGDSVNLSCTIHTETCAGEHSVYWFRHGSEESHPGILYTHGGRSDQCEKSPEAGSPTQSCVYNLPKRNLSLSDAGTYYCAVASCGEILFGNGSKLNVCEPHWTLTLTFSALVTSNVFFMILIIVLTVRICQKKSNRLEVSNNPRLTTTQQQQDRDELNYAAVSFTPRGPTSRQTRVKTSRDAVMYSEVLLQKEDILD